MQKHRVWILVAFIFSSFAHAANWRENPEFTGGHPCIKDLPKFCANAPFVPTKKNHYRCLGENYSRLTVSCHQFMTTFWKPFACSADILKLCKGEDQNTGRSIPCLERNIGKLAPNCRVYVHKIEALSQARVEQHSACESERQKYCPGKHGMEIGTCMKANESKLSENCKGKIRKLQALL